MSASTSLTARSLASVAACAASGLVLGIDDNVVLLDVDRERLGDVGAWLASGQVRAGLDVDVVALDARLARAQERLARGEVVLPAVPRAGQQRRLGVELEVARPARPRPRRDPPPAPRPPARPPAPPGRPAPGTAARPGAGSGCGSRRTGRPRGTRRSTDHRP